MKPIEDLLKNLARAEVLEFGLVTNRLPSVNIGGKFEPVDDEAPTTDKLLQMLVTMGGSRYVDSLSDKPVQWTTRLDGVGVIAVAAIMRKDIVQARFTVARRDPAPAKGPSLSPPVSGVASPLAASTTSPGNTRGSTREPVAQAAQQAPAQARSAGTGAPPAPPAPTATTTQTLPAAQVQPPTAASGQAQAKPPPQPASGAATAKGPLTGAVPPPDDWDDDDEPTVQTLSPPVKAEGGPGAGSKPRKAPETGAPRHPPPPPPAAGAPPPPPPAARVAERGTGAENDHAAATGAAASATKERPSEPRSATAKERASESRAVAAPERTSEGRPAASPAASPVQERPSERRPSGAPAGSPSAIASHAHPASAPAAPGHAGPALALADDDEDASGPAVTIAEERPSDVRPVASATSATAATSAAKARPPEGERAERVSERSAPAAPARAQISERRIPAERPVHGAGSGGAAAPLAHRPPADSRPAPLEPRRINTPTSVDAVDVEITTSDSAAARARAPELGQPAHESPDHTVEMEPVMVSPEKVRAVTGMTPSGVPSTAPSAVAPAPSPAENKERASSSGLDAFLQMALAARASDVHIIAGRPMMLRVASDLLPRTQPVPPELVERLAREIVPARLREALESEGSCDFAIGHPQHGRYRVNVSRQRTGFKVTMRVIPREVPTVASLGLPAAIAAATNHAQGLVLVTGPMGSGKTSTLAALVDRINRESARHVVTIEDPVEHLHGRQRGLVSQREIGTSARSYAAALRAALREDADVIAVGELRDAETVRLAIAASQTGHLVLGTMSTPSAAKSIDRLIELFPPAEHPQIRVGLAGALKLISGQRLVPSTDRTRLHAAVELLPASLPLYTLIRDGRTYQIPSLQQRGRGLGVVRIDESLAELVRAQKVTLEVAKQLADSPPDLEALAMRGAPSVQPRKA
jgi:twitching motility protein PilT